MYEYVFKWSMSQCYTQEHKRFSSVSIRCVPLRLSASFSAVCLRITQTAKVFVSVSGLFVWCSDVMTLACWLLTFRPPHHLQTPPSLPPLFNGADLHPSHPRPLFSQFMLTLHFRTATILHTHPPLPNKQTYSFPDHYYVIHRSFLKSLFFSTFALFTNFSYF